MEEGIRLNRTTALLLLAFAVALAVGGVVVFAGGAQAAPVQVGASAGQAAGGAAQAQDVQDVYIRALANGAYDTQEISVKKGVPVRLHFTAEPNAGCGRMLVIYGLGVEAVSRSGEEQVVEFTPEEEGTYEYNCGMRMWRPGRLVVA